MLYAGDQDEEESGSEYYDEDLGEALDDMDCSDGVASDSADSSSHADAPTESVFSMIVDTVSASELPEMPKISFAIKPSAPPAPTYPQAAAAFGCSRLRRRRSSMCCGRMRSLSAVQSTTATLPRR